MRSPGSVSSLHHRTRSHSPVSRSEGSICATGCSNTGLQCCLYAAALYGEVSGNWTAFNCASCSLNGAASCAPTCSHAGSNSTYVCGPEQDRGRGRGVAV